MKTKILQTLALVGAAILLVTAINSCGGDPVKADPPKITAAPPPIHPTNVPPSATLTVTQELVTNVQSVASFERVIVTVTSNKFTHMEWVESGKTMSYAWPPFQTDVISVSTNIVQTR